MVLFQLIELNEVAIADGGDDLAGAVMLVVGGVQHQEHVTGCCVGLLLLKNISSRRGSCPQGTTQHDVPLATPIGWGFSFKAAASARFSVVADVHSSGAF